MTSPFRRTSFAGALALSALFWSCPAASANVEFDVAFNAMALDSPASYTANDGMLPGAACDVTFTRSAYLFPALFTLNSSPLSIGTLDDLDTFQPLTITASQAVLLYGGSVSGNGNSVSGTAADLLYVVDGGSLTYNGTGSIQLVAYGNIDTAGTAQMTINAALAGGGGFSKTGTGTLTLTGTNSYSGSTTFAAGVLNVGSAGALGSTGALTFTGGTLRYGAASAGTDFSARFSATTNQAINLDTNGQNVTLGTGFGSAGTSLNKLGTGTLTLNGANTYTGSTNLNGGTVVVNNPSALGSGGSIVFAGGTLRYGDASHTDAEYNIADYSARFGTGSGQLYSVDTNGHNITYATGLTSSGGSLTKLGAGTLTLSGASTYTGDTVVRAGTLSVSDPALLGAAGSAVDLFNGATLVFTNGTVTTSRTYNLGTSTLAPAAGGSITYNGATVNGGILGAGSQIIGQGTTLNDVRTTNSTALSQLGNSTATFNNVTLSGSTTFTQAAGATLNVAGEFVTTPTSTMAINGTVNTAGGSVSGALTINQGGMVNTVGGASSPLYLDGSRGTTVNAGGRLAAASGTSIELGGLLVNNGTQTGTLDVNLGGVARGTGNFGTVNVGQGGYFGPNALTTGNAVATNELSMIRLTGASGLASTAFVGPQLQASPGTANVTSLSLNSGSVFALSIQNAQGSAGQGYDSTHASSTLTLAAGTAAGSQITISVASLNNNGTAGQASGFDPSQNYRFVLVQADGGIGGYNPAEFVVDSSSFQNATGGGNFSVVQQGNNLDLVFTSSAVPEPGTWALVGVGAAGLGLMTLRRRCHVAGA